MSRHISKWLFELSSGFSSVFQLLWHYRARAGTMDRDSKSRHSHQQRRHVKQRILRWYTAGHSQVGRSLHSKKVLSDRLDKWWRPTTSATSASPTSFSRSSIQMAASLWPAVFRAKSPSHTAARTEPANMPSKDISTVSALNTRTCTSWSCLPDTSTLDLALEPSTPAARQREWRIRIRKR